MDKVEMAHGGLLKVVKTDTLVVKYAVLPVTSTRLEFMVEFVEPVPMVPHTLGITQLLLMINNSKAEDAIENKIFEYWRGLILQNGGDRVAEMQWMLDINKIQLIECDLLVRKGPTDPEPKEAALPATKWLRITLPKSDYNGKPVVGWIGVQTWNDIQEVLAGRGPQEVYQFNILVQDLGANLADDAPYWRCCVCRPNKGGFVNEPIELVHVVN